MDESIIIIDWAEQKLSVFYAPKIISCQIIPWLIKISLVWSLWSCHEYTEAFFIDFSYWWVTNFIIVTRNVSGYAWSKCRLDFLVSLNGNFWNRFPLLNSLEGRFSLYGFVFDNQSHSKSCLCFSFNMIYAIFIQHKMPHAICRNWKIF